VGSKGKFDSPPCVACDFIRRRKALGLDVALQMWLRAVKREFQVTLGVRAPVAPPPVFASSGGLSLDDAAAASSSLRQKAGQSSVVDLAATSSVGGSIAELKSLDDHSGATARRAQGKGKGKGKAAGKGKAKRPTGPDLPRTRLSTEKETGEVVEWKGKYGWITPRKPLDHPLAGKHRGRLYIHSQDLISAGSLASGTVCHFHVFSDASGLGAEECVVDGECDPEEEEEEWGDGGEWTDEEWAKWESEGGMEVDEAQTNGACAAVENA